MHASAPAHVPTVFSYIAAPIPLAHEMPYIWHLGRWPDIAVVNGMASFLQGEIDCSTFTAAGDQSRTRSRYLYGAHFHPEGERLVFEISANAFLWKMVRSITGTIIDLEGRGPVPPNSAASSRRGNGGLPVRPRRGTDCSCGTYATEPRAG